MKSVIYLDDGYFKLANIDEWVSLMQKYDNKKLRGRVINMELDLFNALQGSFCRQTQSFLRELYDGN